MSSQIVTYGVDAKTAVSFEIDPVPGFVPATASGAVFGGIKIVVGPAVEVAREVLEQVHDADPDGVEVKFGVKISAWSHESYISVRNSDQEPKVTKTESES